MVDSKADANTNTQLRATLVYRPGLGQPDWQERQEVTQTVAHTAQLQGAGPVCDRSQSALSNCGQSHILVFSPEQAAVF
ncbi:hypothetical protein SKAU_G00293230 [Synaphobranchus kaupii]|uniref:Uncharacterized protein n=1 Tax=Synaphobranchus kaupii TaxID=118154 RepID=A0A9Q1IKD7_SYNKA|nr:hypothetical protein SKAU_G00293230 [Synaphobranchus kaupii]